jgi:hypothetical protein
VAQAISTQSLSHTAILGLRDAESKGSMILQNVRNYLPIDNGTSQKPCVFSNIALRTSNLSCKYHKLAF